MNKAERIFLGVVAAFAVWFGAATWFTLPATGVGPGHLGVGGQPRVVDMPRLERLMRQHYLSNHEAEFYHPVESTAPEPNPRAPADTLPKSKTAAP